MPISLLMRRKEEEIDSWGQWQTFRLVSCNASLWTKAFWVHLLHGRLGALRRDWTEDSVIKAGAQDFKKLVFITYHNSNLIAYRCYYRCRGLLDWGAQTGHSGSW